MKIVPVILSGDSGTRLWPLSDLNVERQGNATTSFFENYKSFVIWLKMFNYKRVLRFI
jgi:hypothetical protein